MLNASDPGTFRAIRELRHLIQDSKKPVIFWVGAGASKWLGYPLWKEIAHELRREFSKYADGFDSGEAVKLIKSNSLPEFSSSVAILIPNATSGS
jgi:hypothetical protein